MRNGVQYLAAIAVAAGAFAVSVGVSSATDVITSYDRGFSSKKVRIFRPPISPSPPDAEEPAPPAPETKVVVNVPVYVQRRHTKYRMWWPYRARDRAFGPSYPGFRKVYFGPLYPF
ncbi:MAG: hypothetical protein ACR2OR_13405 [Hyphomicrobiales bacterium]